MNLRYYAKEDPWQEDDDCRDGRPVTLARMDDGPGSEAIWNGMVGVWQPFPDLWERLIGGDWWDRISEERARRYFDPEAFAGRDLSGKLSARGAELSTVIERTAG
ncbi:hypothetical protein [Synechococcus sp. CBW1107]|uniref:hypothetical protein n=1 Tax=Synechococcus sp. CBW1107 TaxID=2789857 RepID=UPI002AD4E46A|nr:hypothetical protein [Synechococcus sp. CBW1107]CAK6690134.1 hypothetical protein ICNINCKA_00747 [Synechococcus sp. CBW1107]